MRGRPVGQLIHVPRERDRQATRGVDLARQHVGDRGPASGAGIPGSDHRADLVDPRHCDRPAGLEHDRGVAIGRGDRVDQRVLLAVERHRHVERFTGPLRPEHDHHVAVACQRGGGGKVAAIGKTDGRTRQLALDFLHRRRRIVHDRPRPRRRRDPGDGIALRRINQRRPAARKHTLVGMPADDRDPLRLRDEREKVTLVLEQDDPRLGRAAADRGMRGHVDRLLLQRMFEQPLRKHRVEDALRHQVELRRLQRALRKRFAQRRAEERLGVERKPRILVEPGSGRRDRAVRRAPVAHHIALEPPVGAQHVGQQPAVLARMRPIDAVVRAHDRSRRRAFDRELESEQVRYARGAVVEDRIAGIAIGFLVVDRIMLDRRDDMVRLDADHLLADDRSRQQRILAAIFEVTPVARLAQQVDAACEHHVEARSPRLVANHRAACARHGQVPARRDRQTRRQRGPPTLVLRAALGRDADPGIGLELRRNAETRDRRHVSGRPLERFLGGDIERDGKVRAEIAEDQRVLFLTRHRRDQRLRARIRGALRIVPGTAQRRFGPCRQCGHPGVGRDLRGRRWCGDLGGGGGGDQQQRHGHDTKRHQSLSCSANRVPESSQSRRDLRTAVVVPDKSDKYPYGRSLEDARVPRSWPAGSSR